MYREKPVDNEEFPRIVYAGTDWKCPECGRLDMYRYESRYSVGCTLDCLIMQQWDAAKKKKK